jgi:hypothetical protein
MWKKLTSDGEICYECTCEIVSYIVNIPKWIPSPFARAFKLEVVL